MISLQQTLFTMVKNKAFPLRSGTRQGCPLSPLLFNIVLEVLTTVIREEKEIKGIHIRKEVKLSLLAEDIILYIESSKESIRKLLELISILAKLQDIKSIHRNCLHFYILTMKKLEREIKESIPFTIATKRIKYLGINLLT